MNDLFNAECSPYPKLDKKRRGILLSALLML
jgi:hypothetical protein